MSAERPNERLLRTLTRKQLDQVLDLLDSLDCATSMDPGAQLHVTNANQTFRLDLSITRLGSQAQPVLPFALPIETPKGAPPNGAAKLRRIHKKLLEKASATTPIPGKKLIVLAGYKENSYSWAAITLLARHRLLLRTPDGYLRAS